MKKGEKNLGRHREETTGMGLEPLQVIDSGAKSLASLFLSLLKQEEKEGSILCLSGGGDGREESEESEVQHEIKENVEKRTGKV